MSLREASKTIGDNAHKAANTIGNTADQIVTTGAQGAMSVAKGTGEVVKSGFGYLGDRLTSAKEAAKNTLKLGGGRSRRRSKSRKSRHNRRRTRHSRHRRSNSRRRRSHTRRRR